jgi:hypothetical protein
LGEAKLLKRNFRKNFMVRKMELASNPTQVVSYFLDLHGVSYEFLKVENRVVYKSEPFLKCTLLIHVRGKIYQIAFRDRWLFIVCLLVILSHTQPNSTLQCPEYFPACLTTLFLQLINHSSIQSSAITYQIAFLIPPFLHWRSVREENKYIFH